MFGFWVFLARGLRSCAGAAGGPRVSQGFGGSRSGLGLSIVVPFFGLTSFMVRILQ